MSQDCIFTQLRIRISLDQSAAGIVEIHAAPPCGCIIKRVTEGHEVREPARQRVDRRRRPWRREVVNRLMMAVQHACLPGLNRDRLPRRHDATCPQLP